MSLELTGPLTEQLFLKEIFGLSQEPFLVLNIVWILVV
jgi:hypothetical protein